MNADLTWDAPGPGEWYASPEHLPTPVTRLFAELFRQVGIGWARGADRYGLPPSHGTFASVNCWFYYSPGTPVLADVDRLDAHAAETLATRRWVGDLAHWQEVLRPATVAKSRSLLAEDITELSDPELADHLERAIDHFLVHGPQHFEAVHGDVAAGVLLHAARDWDVDPRALIEGLAGQADASVSAERLFDRIAAGLRDAGREEIDDLEDVRSVGGDAAAALDELLEDYAWRVFDNDLIEPTLAERPDAAVQAIRAALVGRSPRRRPTGGSLDSLRARVPDGDRERFDELVADARAAYGANDDNTTVLFAMPLGLVRRAVLEVGRRLVERARLEEPEHALDAERAELAALLAGGGPSAAELAGRADARVRAGAVVPPSVIGSPAPPHPAQELGPNTVALGTMLEAYHAVAWRRGSDPTRACASIGEIVVRGRAVVASDPTDALQRLEPGDVLVAVTTTASYNTIFPVAAAVAVQHGGLMSHAAVLARELGLTAVIGVPDLMDRVHDGDQVEVDPAAGTITVISGPST